MADKMPEIVTWRTPTSPNTVLEVMQSSPQLLETLLMKCDVACPTAPTVNKRLCIFIPGNPGIVDAYRDFCTQMHRLGFDVLVVGFAGHSLVERNEGRLYGLQDQLDLIDTFVRTLLDSSLVQQRYVNEAYGTDKNAGVFLAAHSIGAYIALHVLSHHYATLRCCFGLCPVISRVQAAPKGQRLARWTGRLGLHLASAASSTLVLWPRWARDALARQLCHGCDAAMQARCSQGLRRALLMNVLGMVADEFRDVTQPDATLLARVQDKLYLYYVPRDHWAPPAHAEEVRALCPRLAGYVMESDENVAHAWCITDTTTVIQHGILPYL